MPGEDLNEVAYQLRRDMEIERANRARVAYGDAMAHSEISPEFAAEQLKLARKGKGGNATPEQVQQNKLEEEYDWRADPRFVGEYNARIANDVKFANFIKGDIRNVSMFEKVWHRISGDDGEAKSLGKAVRNSFARGGQNLMNTLPIFGNVSELEDISKEIEHIEQGRKAIAEGKAAEFFGDEDDPSGLAGSYRFQKNADARYAELVERRRMLSGAVARHQQIASLYPQTEAMQEFQNTKGFGEAAGWALTHPLEMLANTGPEMAVQMAPMIALGLATSPAGVAGVALGQGLYSYGMDSSASILEYMGDAGIDVTDPKAIESFFSDRSNPTFTKVMAEAYAHATPTALLDMLAVPAALMRMPARITGRAHRIAPSAARAYNVLMESPRMSRLTSAVLQTQVQGLLGGAGEALGQIAAKGEITSYADIIAEFVGEHFSAPFEVLNASRAAGADLALLKQRNDLMQNHLMEAVDAAQRSTSLPLDPQAHKETLDAAGEQSEENDPVEEALWQRIPFSPEMISDEAKAQLAQESPAFAEALRQAEQTGEEASIAYSDFVTQVARSESATEFVKATHVPMEMSNGEIALVALNQTEEAAQELAEEQRATFRTSLKAVAKEIAAMLEAVPEPDKGRRQTEGKMGVGEKKAVAALVLSHVSAMARDLGITPEEVWKRYGLTGIGSERGGAIDFSRFTAQAGVLAQRAYNGSPNTFDRFSTEHIGEGQGAQAHGWGLYFANSKKVAEWYRRTYSESDSNGYNYTFEDGTSAASLWSIIDDLAEKTGKESFSREEIVSHLEEKRDFWAHQLELKRENGQKEAESAYRAELADIEEQLAGVNERIAELEESIKSADAEELEDLQNELDGLYGERDEISDLREEAEDTYKQNMEEARDTEYEEDQISGIEESIARVGQGVERVRAGRTYQVEIPDTEDMLDEDLEIKEQPAKVRQICEQIAQELGITVTDTMIGEDFYKALMERLGSPKAASMMLNERGIPGIHYLGADDGECFVIFDDAAIEIKAVFQGAANQALGAYLPGARQILLSAQSNKSTFLHETGHWFLDARVRIALELKQQADLTDAQKRFLDLTEKTVAWLMPGKTLEEFASMPLENGKGPRRDADEKFARTYEAYLYEGNAPTGALLSMFRKFSGWLRGVYVSIASIPQAAPMTDGVRELFDGLFVASEQAREAILYRGIYKATEKYIHGEDGADAIKKAIADAYADLEESVREAILSAYTRDAERLRNLRKGEVKRLTKAGVEALERIKSEIRKRVTEEPAQKAYKALTEGTAWGKRGKVKLRILANENRTVGGIDLYTTVDNMLAHEDYVDIEGEDLAKRLGFTSEDEMVKALESRRPIEEVVNEEAAERFMAEHGELATPEAIQKTADLAIYGKAMEALLTNELKGLDKAVGNKTYTKALLKPVVDAVLGRMAFKDLKPAKYRADATRAAVKSLSFLTGKKAYTNKKTGNVSPAVKHDTIAAAQEKRRQLFHSLKAEQAQKIRDEIAKRVKRLKKVISAGNPKNMPVEYLEMVELLCFRYDLINKLSERERVYKTWEEFAKQQTARGIAMPRLPELKGSFGEYTVNEINEILSGIESLAGIGKDLETVRKGVEKIAVEQARKEIAQMIIDNAVRRGMKPILRQRGEGQKSKNEMTFRKFFYSHRRIASFLQCMEGTQFGKLWEYVVKPFDAAGNREIAMRAELSAKAAKIFEPLRSLSERHKPIYRERLGASFTDAEILAMALNLNSEENLQRLLAGSTRYAGRKGKDRWTAEDVISTVSEVLTADQLAAVQEVWDLCGSLWDDVVELEHDMNHRAPKPVKPRETKFTLLDGEVVTLRGGYYPVRYDKNISDVAPGENIDDDHSNALSAITGRPHTPDRSHTLERTNGVPPGRAIELTLTAGFSGLDAIVHDLCWRRELTQMDKLFAPNGEFRTAVKDYWGAEAVEEIKKWIEDIAAGDKGQSESADVIANALRSNVSLAGIGFNLVTAAVQLTGLTQSVVALGPKWAMTGLGEFMKNPRQMLELARSKSQLMADRGRTQFRELGEVHSSIAGTVSKPMGMIMKYAYMPIVLVQTMVDVPTWLGGYHKALADGCSEREAIARADRVLIDSQGSGRLQDLAGVERSGPWKKLFTVFYTFFSATYNLALVKGQTETGVRRALDLLALLAVQPVLEGFLREALKVGGDDDDDDDWPLKYLAIAGQSVASFNMGMLVGVRELSGIIDGFGYRGPTGMRKIEDIYKLATQVKQGEFDEGLLRALNSVASDWVGYPAVPINRAISGVNALANDETDNWLAPFLGYSKY